MPMPHFEDDPKKDVVITFGVSGWSSWFCGSYPEDYDIDKLYDYCQRRVPNDVKATCPENEKVQWIKIYRLENHKVFIAKKRGRAIPEADETVGSV